MRILEDLQPYQIPFIPPPSYQDSYAASARSIWFYLFLFLRCGLLSDSPVFSDVYFSTCRRFLPDVRIPYSSGFCRHSGSAGELPRFREDAVVPLPGFLLTGTLLPAPRLLELELSELAEPESDSSSDFSEAELIAAPCKNLFRHIKIFFEAQI